MTQTTGADAFRRVALAPGLYLVATPIGTARDITLRALDILASADIIAAEDTRTARHLMDLHGIPLGDRPLLAYHDHNGAAQRPRLLGLLAEGRSIAYVSEAGTPLVADPGYQLARLAAEAGETVTAAPGPSAVLAALSLSGLPSDRFLFAGFPPTSAGARRQWLAETDNAGATVILFESPKRIKKTLDEMVQVLGEGRRAALCRELTKRFEEVRNGTLAELAASVAADPPRGEIVLVLDRPEASVASEAEVEDQLRTALATLSVREASDLVARSLGRKRRDVYQAALAIKGEEK